MLRSMLIVCSSGFCAAMAAELNTSLHAEHPDWTGRAGRDVTPLGPLRINLTLDWWGLRSVSEFYLNELDPYGGIKRARGAAGGFEVGAVTRAV